MSEMARDEGSQQNKPGIYPFNKGWKQTGRWRGS